MTHPTLNATRPLNVVPHTHWDREWYRPFEAYRFRLVETLDGLLAADLPYFLLDGQTVVLDDYLALRPEQREAIAARVREGKLGLGPWYVLVDEFLVSGESLVRNLLVGRQAMAAFGATAPVGYLPDMFGHIAQMPQILAGFGLDRAVVWRGANPGASRFVWRAPNGSEVATAWLRQGYYQTMFLVELSEEERIKQVADYLAAFGPDEPVLLLSGADHMAPRADLAAQLDQVNQALPGLTARVTPLHEALDGPRPQAVLEGELREPVGMAYLLPGVLSARTYLKQANAECQTLLERYVEPLTALAWAGGRAYPAPFVRHAWQELMKNHPHDSICGCSIDQVHREMMPRFAAVRQLSDELVGRSVAAYPKPSESPSLFVFNPTNGEAEAWVEATVHWPIASAPEAIHLTLADGRQVPTVLRSVEDTDIFRAEVDFNPDWFPVRRFQVAAAVPLPSAGGVRLVAAPGAPTPVAPGVSGDDQSIENAHLRLEIGQGKVSLTDKASGERYTDCHYFLDQGDAGDEYNFSPLADDQPRRSVLSSARLVSLEPHKAVLEATYHLEVPRELAPGRQTRSEATCRLELRSRFTLEADSRVLAVETTFDNQAKDHRLQVVTALGPGAEPAVWSDSAFGVFRRTLQAMSPLPVPKRTEAIMPEFPQGGFTALERSDRGLAVFNQGLPEASVSEGESGWALATTLVRSVGWLSRDDLRARGGGAGPRFEAPEAQCQGEQTFHYALAPFQGAWTEVLPAAQRYAAPAKAWEAEGLPLEGASVTLADSRLVLSALKRSEQGEHLVVRAYNPTPEAIGSTLTVHVPHARVLESNMAEEPGAEAGVSRVMAAFGPYEIKTWMIEL